MIQTEEPAADPPAPKGHDGRGSKGTLLLVEDEASVRRFVRTVLQNNGFKVFEAADGIEAMGLLETGPEPIPLLVTDLVMPRMGGDKLAERFLAMNPLGKVLMISGYTDRAIATQIGIDGRSEYLQKPFDSEQLLAKVNQLVSQRIDSTPWGSPRS
jgi:two-component system cell cycle sensor histidine kinase/response regulator CckA